MSEFLKVVLYGIVEGITEWLPVSSTGHMILLNEVLPLRASPALWDLFLVMIQLGAILAVIVLYWKRLIPFRFVQGIRFDRKKWILWCKIIVASIPAGVIGILWDDLFTRLFYNYFTVATMLILVGVMFILIENRNKDDCLKCHSVEDISLGQAFLIGMFQALAAIFPGTSRSGSTIMGSLLIGISRSAAAEFTFFLAIPAMLGGSAVKLMKYEGGFAQEEMMILIVGMMVAFAVSMIAIKFLISFIQKHNFKIFGWYRILLGTSVLMYFIFRV